MFTYLFWGSKTQSSINWRLLKRNRLLVSKPHWRKPSNHIHHKNQLHDFLMSGCRGCKQQPLLTSRVHSKCKNGERIIMIWKRRLTLDPNLRACSRHTEIEAQTEQSVTMCWSISCGSIRRILSWWGLPGATSRILGRRQTGETLACSGDNLGCPSGSLCSWG